MDSSELVAATLVQHPKYVDVSDGKWEVVPAPLAEVGRLRARVSQLDDSE